MNGIYLRELAPDAYADVLLAFLREQGSEWDEERIREAGPIVQEKIGRLGEFAGFAGLSVRGGRSRSVAARRGSPHRGGDAARDRSSRGTPRRSRSALKALCERLEAKPKTVYLPIRVAVTGSRISPGLYESLELLGRDVRSRAFAAPLAPETP